MVRYSELIQSAVLESQPQGLMSALPPSLVSRFSHSLNRMMITLILSLFKIQTSVLQMYIVIRKLGKILSSIMGSQNALQTVVGVVNWSPHFMSTHNARYCKIVPQLVFEPAPKESGAVCTVAHSSNDNNFKALKALML